MVLRTKPRIAQIIDGKDIINEEFSKLNTLAFKMLSTDFQHKVEQLKAKESDDLAKNN